MSDTMPERNIADLEWPAAKNISFDVIMVEGRRFVPEQRALDAEADHIGASTERDKLADECNKLAAMVDTLRAERDALQADLKALLPLALYALFLWETGDESMDAAACHGFIDLDDDGWELSANTETAKAILDRETK